MELTALRENVIQLVQGSGGRVTVTDEDEDRFSLHIDDAVLACRSHHDAEKFRKQVHILLNRLHKWSVEHGDDIRGSVLVMQEMGFLLICITKQAPISAELDNDLTSLELEIANDSDIKQLPFSGQLLPPLSDDATRGFIPTDRFAWLVFPIEEDRVKRIDKSK